MITKDDLRSLVAQIKKETHKTQREISEGAGYKADSLSELLAQKNSNCEPVYRQLELVYAEVLKKSMQPEAQPGNNNGHESPTMEELSPAQIMTILARANEKYAESLRLQAELLKDMHSGMARQETLKNVDSNSTETLAGVLSLSKRQKGAIADIRRDLAEIKYLLVDQRQVSDKKSRDSDVEGRKRGSTP